MKECNDCCETKANYEFYRVKNRKDGLASECKMCWSKKWPRNKETEKKSRLKNRKAIIERNKRYQIEKANQWNANATVRTAVKEGRLKKLPCEVCGSKKLIHGHHSDYSKPLEVIWLCPYHHKQEHKRINIARQLIR